VFSAGRCCINRREGAEENMRVLRFRALCKMLGIEGRVQRGRKTIEILYHHRGSFQTRKED
jgi:hypothetical protein